jgi:hypothetical protein
MEVGQCGKQEATLRFCELTTVQNKPLIFTLLHDTSVEKYYYFGAPGTPFHQIRENPRTKLLGLDTTFC